MIYSFKCECGFEREVTGSIQVGPPVQVNCRDCGMVMQRDWKADAPTLDTSACRDHNFIPHGKRVMPSTVRLPSKSQAWKQEQAYKRDIEKRRAAVRAGGNQGSFKQTMAVPAELYHGKIKETGDRDYWKDSKNVSRHSDFEVKP